jgi:hypothetical protein
MYQIISNVQGSLSTFHNYPSAVQTALAWSQLRGEELYVFFNGRCIFDTTDGKLQEQVLPRREEV